MDCRRHLQNIFQFHKVQFNQVEPNPTECPNNIESHSMFFREKKIIIVDSKKVNDSSWLLARSGKAWQAGGFYFISNPPHASPEFAHKNVDFCFPSCAKRLAWLLWPPAPIPLSHSKVKCELDELSLTTKLSYGHNICWGESRENKSAAVSNYPLY